MLGSQDVEHDGSFIPMLTLNQLYIEPVIVSGQHKVEQYSMVGIAIREGEISNDPSPSMLMLFVHRRGADHTQEGIVCILHCWSWQ